MTTTTGAGSGVAAMLARINEIEALVGPSRSGAAGSAGSTGLSGSVGLSGSAGSAGSTSATAFAGALGQALAAVGEQATPTPGAKAVPGGSRAVDLATSYTGVRYLWGGTDPAKGLDCSGLVQLVYRKLGVELPRTSAQQSTVGERVASLKDARPGDLVFFGSPVHHVGIYAGDGKMIDAPRRGKTVGLHDLWSSGPTVIRRVGVPTAAGSAATSGSGTGTASAATASTTAAVASSAATAATAGTTATLNALISAGMGFGPGAPGGILGQAGSHLVPVTTRAEASLPVTPSGSGAVAGARALGRTAVATPSDGSAGLSGPYAELFVAAGRAHGVDPALLSAIAKAESAYNPAARSRAGAIGLMQIMPGTAKDLGVDPTKPAEAVDGAARLIARYLKRYDGQVDLALAAYNAGPGAVRRYGGVPPYAETTAYVRRVSAYWEDLR